MAQPNARIYHVSRSEMLLNLRDDILRLQGFEVASSLSFTQALNDAPKGKYDLILIDVDGEQGVAEAEQLCADIVKIVPGQHVAYVCNYRVAIDSDCPVAVIRAEFDPEGMVRSIKQVLAEFQ